MNEDNKCLFQSTNDYRGKSGFIIWMTINIHCKYIISVMENIKTEYGCIILLKYKRFNSTFMWYHT